MTPATRSQSFPEQQLSGSERDSGTTRLSTLLWEESRNSALLAEMLIGVARGPVSRLEDEADPGWHLSEPQNPRF